MINEKTASFMLNYNNWKISATFTDNVPLSNISLSNKDITKHNNYEILVGLEGSYPYYYNGKCYNSEPGSIFLISPMLEHESYYTDVKHPLTHLWMNVEEDSIFVSISHVSKDKTKRLFQSKIFCNNYRPRLKIYDQWNYLLAKQQIKSKDLFELKLAINHLFLAIIESNQLSINEYQDEIMHKARNYIRNNFRQKINLEHLAIKMGYSKFHFLRLFKKYHTVTVQEYIDQQRLKEVKYLLESKIAKKEIAYQLGFSSPSSFCNWYAKYRDKQI